MVELYKELYELGIFMEVKPSVDTREIRFIFKKFDKNWGITVSMDLLEHDPTCVVFKLRDTLKKINYVIWEPI